MKYIIGGPCGIGKSTLARLIADRYEIANLDLDEIRGVRNQFAPCSLKYLNIENCIKDILDECRTGFVLDIGGDTIFRKGIDNQERTNQVLRLKSTYNAKLIVLFAEKREAYQRFLTTGSHEMDKFSKIWNAWEKIEKPHWLQCSDKFIDTTGLTPEDIISVIIET